ncbi:hypothetical protein PCASD_17879 [Puccinia coronata f. sp. avenae]|uniref:Uncharacterized protein n=1 Tax=Puccinia coronata f. sp. avenae TaxID=200324 RepID=A0A2N5U147_9BASI|nr:hypothetical protein PCASD_17879 [Puccinia coronata f. sp. avenae]
MTASTSFGSDCVVVRNNSTNKISIVELTKVQIKCTLWFVEPFDLPQLPLLATGAQTAYDISNPSLPPFTMAFRQNVMSFNDFKNAVVAEISTFAPGNLLRDALNTAASLGRVQWHYSIKEADGSRKWSAEAHLADKYPEFISATRTFPYNANVSVHLKMDKPKGDETGIAGGVAVGHQPGPVPDIDFTLRQFFDLCKIDFDNNQIQALIIKNLIFHWTSFKGASIHKIETLGFKSASCLIYEGTKKAICKTNNN